MYGSESSDTYFDLFSSVSSVLGHPALRKAAAGKQFYCQADVPQAMRSTNFIQGSYVITYVFKCTQGFLQGSFGEEILEHSKERFSYRVFSCTYWCCSLIILCVFVWICVCVCVYTTSNVIPQIPTTFKILFMQSLSLIWASYLGRRARSRVLSASAAPVLGL